VVITEVLSSTGALEEISAEWNQLYNDSLTATPFQAPFWVIPWWRNFGSGNLCTIAIRDSRKLVGLVSFYMYSDNKSERVLYLTGTGISDYLNVLYLSEYSGIVTEQISNYLKKHTGEWDRCDFQELPENSLLLKAYENSSQFRINMGKQSECSFIETVPDGSLKNTLPGKLRKNAKDYLNKIKAVHTYQFEKTENPEDLVILHSKRWHDKNESGVLENSVVQKFHKEVSEHQYSNGNVHYFMLKIEMIPAACYYVLTRKPHAYFYLSGFDPLYSRFSPGTVALFLSINNLSEKGITCFDFLRGNEAYKKFWGVKLKSNYRLQIFKNTEGVA
jgi:CelD/BcsL family acetyltransferase involved in cellulose biosynthesis